MWLSFRARVARETVRHPTPAPNSPLIVVSGSAAARKRVRVEALGGRGVAFAPTSTEKSAVSRVHPRAREHDQQAAKGRADV